MRRKSAAKDVEELLLRDAGFVLPQQLCRPIWQLMLPLLTGFFSGLPKMNEIMNKEEMTAGAPGGSGIHSPLLRTLHAFAKALLEDGVRRSVARL